MIPGRPSFLHFQHVADRHAEASSGRYLADLAYELQCRRQDRVGVVCAAILFVVAVAGLAWMFAGAVGL